MDVDLHSVTVHRLQPKKEVSLFDTLFFIADV